MPKPIVINTISLVRNKNGTYALDLLANLTDSIHHFELTQDAFEQLKADTASPFLNVLIVKGKGRL
jgi:hypothetical protein